MMNPTMKGAMVCNTALKAVQISPRCSSVTANAMPTQTTMMFDRVLARISLGISDFMCASGCDTL